MQGVAQIVRCVTLTILSVPQYQALTYELLGQGIPMPELSVSVVAPDLPSRISALVDRFAPHDCPVVITGPIGVGKTHLARILHDRSGRRGSFVPVPLTSLQAGFEHVTLAGHDKGAYTGAHQRRGGLLAEANGGTLFLDEIGDASLEGQRLLLELLTERGLRRLGEERRLRFDLRFVLATHVDLDRATAEGRFREDLLSRLGNCWIHLPPLRERPEEIPALITHYLDRFSTDRRMPRLRPTKELWPILVAAPWIYNVRSLVNECQALVTAAPVEGDLGIQQFSSRFWREVRAHLRTIASEDERMALALLLSGDRRVKAAELLGVSERGVYRKVASRRGVAPRATSREGTMTNSDPDDELSGSVA
jgi:two-component system, NtrC family, response regulator AtoC